MEAGRTVRADRVAVDATAILEMVTTTGALPEDIAAVLAHARRDTVPAPGPSRRATGPGPELRRRPDLEAGLTALVDTARELTAPADLETVLRILARRARLLISADIAYIGLRERPGAAMTVRVSDGHVSALNIGLHVPADSGLGGAVLTNPSPIWSPDYLHDDRFPHDDRIDAVVRAESLRAIMAVPLGHDGTTVGALYVGNRSVRHFTHAEVSLLNALSELAGGAIEKTRLLEAAITEAAHWRDTAVRAGAEAEALRRHELAYRRLSDCVLAGGGPGELIDLAGSLLPASLRLLGPDGVVLAAAGPAPDTEADDLTAALTAHAGDGPVALGSGWWAAPVPGGAAGRSTVLLWQPEPLDATGISLLGHLARTAALTPAARPSTLDDVLDDVPASALPGSGHPVRAAPRVDLRLTVAHTMLVARVEDTTRRDAAVWAPRYARRRGGLAGVRDGNGVLLLPGDDPGTLAQAVSEELTTLLGAPVTVGASGGVSSSAEVPRAYREALQSLTALGVLGVPGRGASSRELGFFGVLLSDRHDVAGYVETTIGALLAQDRLRGTDLVATLEEYFAAGQSPTRAARRLHVHSNTVTRRLERVAALLGEDWQTPEHILELQLALRLHRLRLLLIRSPG